MPRGNNPAKSDEDLANTGKICEKCTLNYSCGLNNMQPDDIKQLIEAGMATAQAIVDGDGAHFTAIVICPLFEGKSRIQKQQLVYDTVRKELLDGSLHALSLKTFTPDEWQHAKDRD